MVNKRRMRRLQTGIDSIERKIKEHEDKIEEKLASNNPDPEAIAYWSREIDDFRKQQDRRTYIIQKRIRKRKRRVRVIFNH